MPMSSCGDSSGHLSELDNPNDASNPLIVHYTYYSNGDLQQKDMGNGTRTVYTYDGDGNVLSVTNYAPADPVTGMRPVNSFDVYTWLSSS